MSAYVVLMARVDDPKTYSKYTAKTPTLIEKYGGKFLVRGGEVETIEGEPYKDRLVVLEFPSKQAIRDFFSDPEYREAAKFRHAAAEARILAADGFEG